MNGPSLSKPTVSKTLRWTAVLLACALLAGCGGAALYSNLDEQQANELMAALLDGGVHAEKAPSPSKNGWEVQVGRGEFPLAMQILRSKGLPRAEYRSLGDVFKKEGFASSSLEERARYQYGQQQELERTLSLIDGVVEARVHIAFPERDPLGGDSKVSSASVVIYEQPGVDLRDRETDLKVIIKDGVQGLDDVNKVTVKFFSVAAPASAGKARVAGGTPLPMSLSSISPLAIGIAIGVVILLALLVGLIGRLRGRAAPAPVQPRGVWNG